MDDIHEGTRLAAQGSVTFLSKVGFLLFLNIQNFICLSEL